MAKKYKNELREFLAIVTGRGEKVVIDEQLVKKYNLRAGMLSPFSSHPIVTVTKKVRVEVAPRRKMRIRLKQSKSKKRAKTKAKTGAGRRRSRR